MITYMKEERERVQSLLCGVPRMRLRPRQAPGPATRTINWRRVFLETGQRRRGFVLGLLALHGCLSLEGWRLLLWWLGSEVCLLGRLSGVVVVGLLLYHVVYGGSVAVGSWLLWLAVGVVGRCWEVLAV